MLKGEKWIGGALASIIFDPNDTLSKEPDVKGQTTVWLSLDIFLSADDLKKWEKQILVIA